MNSRLLALIDRGYSKEEVLNLASFTDEELEYCSNLAFNNISYNCTPVNDKIAIYIGGQPGSGKTVLSMDIKNKIGNIIEIGIDNYRIYHPNYLKIEKCIREHWKNRIENENDTPGNDIADFTHFFAGAMTDKLIEKTSNGNYNMILEWGMREPIGPLNNMKDLKNKNYKNTVLFVSTHKDISYEACKLRADVMSNSNHIIRKVPKYFHDYCVETLPKSINTIYEEGYKNNCIDYMALIDRKGKIIWDDKNKEMPGNIYNEYLNNEKSFNNVKNDVLLSIITSKNEINKLKETYTIFIPEFIENSIKTK